MRSGSPPISDGVGSQSGAVHGRSRVWTRHSASPVSLGATLTEMMLADLIPTIERTHRVLPGRENRAMAGLSMGGMQTFQTTLSNLDKFTYIGGFSGSCGGRGAAMVRPREMAASPESSKPCEKCEFEERPRTAPMSFSSAKPCSLSVCFCRDLRSGPFDRSGIPAKLHSPRQETILQNWRWPSRVGT
jgi:hypothetical protein